MTKHLIAARLMYVGLLSDGTVRTIGKVRAPHEKLCLIAPCTTAEGQALISLINAPHNERLERLTQIIYRYEGDNAGEGFTPGLAAAILTELGLDSKRERLPINQAKRREKRAFGS